jgi:CPA2 family monovalent cation:H+ antiporter-2
MPHGTELPLLHTLAVGLCLALVLGYLALRIRLPPMVGYIAAGIVCGPFTPGLTVDRAVAGQFADIGVMLLLFGVGLRFHLRELQEVRHVALPGSLAQVGITGFSGFALAHWGWDWSPEASAALGASLSAASTVVLVRTLEAHGEIERPWGRTAVGWLVVEDVVSVVLLVLLPALGSPGGASLGPALRATLLASAFVVLMLVGGRKLFPALLWRAARTGSRELFTLSVVAIAVGIAFGGASLFGVSYALGAFLAGMVLRESDFSHRAAERVLPLQDAFSVLFFVSIGMLLDPRVLVERPSAVVSLVALVVVGKMAWGFLLARLRGAPASLALRMGAGIAQIGEFSFLLAGAAHRAGILPRTGLDLVLATGIVSLTLHAPLVAAIPRLESALRRTRLRRLLIDASDPLATIPASVPMELLTGQVVLVGWDRVGAQVGRSLRERGIKVVVLDPSAERVESLRAEGIPAVRGETSDPAALIQAHIARAGMVVADGTDPVRTASLVEVARALNPKVEIAFHLGSAEEAGRLRGEGCRTFLHQETAAKAVSDHVLSRFGKD